MKKEFKLESNGLINLYFNGELLKGTVGSLLESIGVSEDVSAEEAVDALTKAGFVQLPEASIEEPIFVYIEEDMSDSCSEDEGVFVWLTRKSYFEENGSVCSDYDPYVNSKVEECGIDIEPLAESMYLVTHEDLEDFKKMVEESTVFTFDDEFTALHRELSDSEYDEEEEEDDYDEEEV